jgi:peptidoglycan/LPS O-acetylase OafA/YrhL
LIVTGMIGLGVMFHYVGYVIAGVVYGVPILLDRGDLSINVVDWLEYYGPLVRTLEFCVGCLCAEIYRRGGIRIPTLGVTVAIGWCVLVIAIGHGLGLEITPLLPNFIYAPALAVIILAACRTGLLAGLLGAKPIIFAGEISYSVYLLQSLIAPAALEPFEATGFRQPPTGNLGSHCGRHGRRHDELVGH